MARILIDLRGNTGFPGFEENGGLCYVDPSAAAVSRRAEFLGMRRADAEFFKRFSQPNIFRRKFGANIQRSLNETVYIKSSHFS